MNMNRLIRHWQGGVTENIKYETDNNYGKLYGVEK
jgi:hypothetical protein